MAFKNEFTRVNHPAFYAKKVWSDLPHVVVIDEQVRDDNRSDNYSFHDHNIPAWQDKMKAGEDVTTRLMGIRRTARRKTNGFYEIWDATQSPMLIRGQVVGMVHKNSPVLGTVSPSVVDQARTAAMVAFSKNWGKKSRQWDSGVFAGELFEVAKMLANPAKGLRSAADDLFKAAKRAIKGKKPGSSAYRKNLVGSYLEWTFGVKPLVSDLDNAATAFRSMASGRCFDMIRITGEGAIEQEYQVGYVDQWDPGASVPGTAAFDYYLIDYSGVTIRGAWRNDNPSGATMPLPQIIGTDLSRLLPTAWELLPWSFLADYFTNIGDVLDAWSMRFINFAWLNQTVRNCRTAVLSDIRPCMPASTGWYTLARGGHTVLKEYHVSREPIANQWDPGFYMKFPGFAGNDAKKWINVSALLAMRLS